MLKPHLTWKTLRPNGWVNNGRRLLSSPAAAFMSKVEASVLALRSVSYIETIVLNRKAPDSRLYLLSRGTAANTDVFQISTFDSIYQSWITRPSNARIKAAKTIQSVPFSFNFRMSGSRTYDARFKESTLMHMWRISEGSRNLAP